MEDYVIAVKRDARGNVPPDWQRLILDIETVEMVGEPRPRRMLIRAQEPAIRKIHELLGGYCHIEPVMRHQTY